MIVFVLEDINKGSGADVKWSGPSSSLIRPCWTNFLQPAMDQPFSRTGSIENHVTWDQKRVKVDFNALSIGQCNNCTKSLQCREENIVFFSFLHVPRLGRLRFVYIFSAYLLDRSLICEYQWKHKHTCMVIP